MLLLAGSLFGSGILKKEGRGPGIGQLFLGQVEIVATALWCPVLVFADREESGGIWQVVAGQFPLLHFLETEKEHRLLVESGSTYEEIIRAERSSEALDSVTGKEPEVSEDDGGRLYVSRQQEELLRRENEHIRKGRAAEAEQISDNGMRSEDIQTEERQESVIMHGELPLVPATEIRQQYQWEHFQKYDELVKEFYAVDAATAIDERQLNLKALLGRDLTVQKRTDDKPQILIYHTHSQEGFANSVPGDANTTIMGVGEVLSQLLREQYGYNVMHHLGQYDVENRDYAYNNSLPALERLLAENPSIEVVIDLHRDEMPPERKLVTEIEGRKTAKFMFFNGLSRTRKHGDIEYLPNENIADNLAFSFQMQALCNAYYPGLARRIYLKGYRYNMHLKPRYLLIEMGAQNNTYEECYNACVLLAQMLDLELSGVDFGYAAP